MKITNINRQALGIIQEEISESVQTILEEHGLMLDSNSGSYGGLEGSLKFSFSVAAEDGFSAAKREEWENHTKYDTRGLKPEWFGESFTHQGGDTYQIIGYRPRATRRPILTNGENGKQYTWTAEAVIKMMNRTLESKS